MKDGLTLVLKYRGAEFARLDSIQPIIIPLVECDSVAIGSQ